MVLEVGKKYKLIAMETNYALLSLYCQTEAPTLNGNQTNYTWPESQNDFIVEQNEIFLVTNVIQLSFINPYLDFNPVINYDTGPITWYQITKEYNLPPEQQTRGYVMSFPTLVFEEVP